MIIRINNKAKYKHIYFVCGGKRYLLTDKTLEISTTCSTVKAVVEILDRSTVVPNLIDLCCGILDSESVLCKIKSSYVFEMESNMDCCTLIVEDVVSEPVDNIIFESVYVNSMNATIKTLDYKISNMRSIKNKHTFIQLFFLSSLPITFLLLLLCVFDFSFVLIIAILLDIVFLVLPSLKRIKLFNSVFNEENAKKLLLDSEMKLINGQNEEVENITKTEKLLFKIFDKIFK